jgi:hypothetical protein
MINIFPIERLAGIEAHLSLAQESSNRFELSTIIFPFPISRTSPGSLIFSFRIPGRNFCSRKYGLGFRESREIKHLSLFVYLSIFCSIVRSFVRQSFSLSLLLSFLLSYHHSFPPSFFLSFFFSRLEFLILTAKFDIFLAPEIRDETGNFSWCPKIDGEKRSGAVLPIILGTAET